MISTKVCSRIAVGALAAGVVLAPTVAQAAAPSPYAEAAAAVNTNGTLAYGKDIVSVTRPSLGRYCITTGSDIDLSTAAVQVTLRGTLNRTYAAWTTPRPECDNRADTVTVAINTSNTVTAVDGAFFLTIP